MNKVRWGVLGLGWVASDFLAPAMMANSQAELAACAGSTLDKARSFAERFGVERVHGTMEGLMTDPELDAIYIATPNAHHHAAVLAGAAAGKAMLCEKPFAMQVGHAQEMVDACAEAGVLLRIAHQIRLDAAVGRAREIVRSGRLGKLTAITLERASGLGSRPPWREDVTQSGVVFDVGVHLLDLVQWVSRESYEEVAAFTHPDRNAGLPDDTVTVLGRLESGCQAVIRATREVASAENNLIIEGTQATLRTSALRFAPEHVITIRGADWNEEERFAASPAYALEVDAFQRELSGERSVLPDGVEALQMVGVTEAVLKSVRDRRIVPVVS